MITLIDKNYSNKSETIQEWLALSFAIHLTAFFLILGLVKVNIPKKQHIESSFKIDLLYNDDYGFIDAYNQQIKNVDRLAKKLTMFTEKKSARELIDLIQPEIVPFYKNNLYSLRRNQELKKSASTEINTIKNINLGITNNKSLLKDDLKKKLNNTFPRKFPEQKTPDLPESAKPFPKPKPQNESEHENELKEQSLSVNPGESDANICTKSQINLGKNISGSFDPSDPNIKYNWQMISKPQNSQSVLTNATTQFSSFIPDVEGIYMVGLVVSKDGFKSQISQISFKAVNLDKGVRWNGIEGVISYKIILRMQSYENESEIPIEAGKTSYTFKGLLKNTVYNTAIIALVDDGSGYPEATPMTEVIQFTTCHDYDQMKN